MKKNKRNIIFILFILSISLFSLCSFQIESDYLWHIKAGEYMLSHGILKYDVFSWTLSSSYWFSHEWFFEVVLYLLKVITGKYHLFIYCFSMIFLMNFIIYSYNKNNIEKNLLFTVIWFLFSLLISFQVQARPHLFSYLLFTVMMYLLMNFKNNKNSKSIYLLPVIGILWSNIHGGSSNLVYLIPGVFFFCELFTHKLSSNEIKKYIILLLFCFLSCMINIHGIKMIYYPYMNMANSLMITNISEWRSTSFSEPIHYVYIIFVLFLFFIIYSYKKKISILDFILLFIGIFLGLKSIRFWYYTYLISSFFIFSYIKKRREDRGTYSCIIFLSILFSSLFLLRTSIFTTNYSFLLNEEDISVIEKEKPKRLFNMYNYGGDLIYHNIPVFIDGRADLYSPYYYSDYLEISNLKWKSVSYLDKYDFDYLLVNKDYPIASYLEHSNNYERIYSREDVYFYKKTTN